jgi:hypothetical protein
MEFVEYSEAYRDALLEFSRRLGANSAGAVLGMPFGYYAPSPGISVRRHLLMDDSVTPNLVVAAIYAKVQDYVIGGEPHRIAVLTYPISLGVVDPAYAMAAMILFRKALEAYPLNLLLGMGPPESNVTARMCKLLGWSVSPVPYLFMPQRLAALAAKQLASRRPLALLAELASASRILAPLDALLAARAVGRRSPALTLRPVDAFDASLDEWWRAFSASLGFGLVRDSRQLNAMFPPSVPAFEKLVFQVGGVCVGYAVLLVPEASAARAERGVNLVTVIDFCADAGQLDAAAAALASHLVSLRSDAAIVNTPHCPTLEVLKAHGFFGRTTSFYLALSPPLRALLDERGIPLNDMIVTRADGDGPIGLGADL